MRIIATVELTVGILPKTTKNPLKNSVHVTKHRYFQNS